MTYQCVKERNPHEDRHGKPDGERVTKQCTVNEENPGLCSTSFDLRIYT